MIQKLSRFVCDRKTCDNSKIIESDDKNIMPDGWMEMNWNNTVLHFCSNQCAFEFLECESKAQN